MTRSAVVTGAARGIGAATVRRLSADGWKVLAVDVCADDPSIPYALATPDDLDQLARLDGVSAAVADVRDRLALEAAVATAVERFGGLDVAVAAAGVVAGGAPHWESDVDAERVVVDVDLVGVMNLARVAVPAMLTRPEPRSGRFIAVASTAAVRGLDKLAAYCAAKAGVIGFVRALAAELGASGVTANAVNPGSTETDALIASARLYGLPDTTAFVEQQPLGRLLTPDEVASAIVWLAGEASSGVTGSAMAVDGGLAL